MPNPDEMQPDPEVTRRLRELFAPTPREMPDLEEQIRELERKIAEPA